VSARELAEEFFGHVEAGEVGEILGMMTPDAANSARRRVLDEAGLAG
jgi:hypothetical protein